MYQIYLKFKYTNRAENMRSLLLLSTIFKLGVLGTSIDPNIVKCAPS